MDMTVTEAAQLRGVDPRSVRKLAELGRIPGARKSGGTWLLPREAILALPEPRTGAATAAA